MKYPVQNKEVIWRRVGDTVVVIKEDGLSSHTLNKTAAYIWELCDGTRDINEIANNIHERFEVEFKIAYTDTETTIEELVRAGIMSTAKVAKNRIRY